MGMIEQTLSERADERDLQENGRNASGLAAWLVNIAIGISAFLTVIYLMLLVDAAVGLPDPYGLLFGLLVGTVAIVPAEMALIIWQIRLRSDGAITGGQRMVAVTGMIMAGIFSALTTSSFFSYFLPQLFPASYTAIAPSLNVAAIVGSWIVFILATVAYVIFSRQTRQNLAEASAYQAVFDARMTVLRSAGEAIRLEADAMVNRMDADGVFAHDARNLILSSLGMDEGRVDVLPASTASPAPSPAAPAPPPSPAAPPPAAARPLSDDDAQDDDDMVWDVRREPEFALDGSNSRFQGGGL